MKPCILPWINFSTTTFGRPRVCGYSDDATLKKVNVKLKDSDVSTEFNNEYFIRIYFRRLRKLSRASNTVLNTPQSIPCNPDHARLMWPLSSFVD